MNDEFDFIAHTSSFIVSYQRACWTVQTINKGQIAKKVLDDIRSISLTKRLPWGSRQCRVNRNYGHRGGSFVFIATDPDWRRSLE